MKKGNTSHYETPGALRHDSELIVDEARALLEATTDIADEKITEARQRLESALEQARESYGDLRDRAIEKAQRVDVVIRRHPYETIALACGLGALLGALLARRH